MQIQNGADLLDNDSLEKELDILTYAPGVNDMMGLLH